MNVIEKCLICNETVINLTIKRYFCPYYRNKAGYLRYLCSEECAKIFDKDNPKCESCNVIITNKEWIKAKDEKIYCTWFGNNPTCYESYKKKNEEECIYYTCELCEKPKIKNEDDEIEFDDLKACMKCQKILDKIIDNQEKLGYKITKHK